MMSLKPIYPHRSEVLFGRNVEWVSRCVSSFLQSHQRTLSRHTPASLTINQPPPPSRIHAPPPHHRSPLASARCHPPIPSLHHAPLQPSLTDRISGPQTHSTLSSRDQNCVRP